MTMHWHLAFRDAARIACLILLGARVENSALPAGDFATWVLSSLERAGPNDPPGPAASATLSAARGEYESFQIVVNVPDSGLTNVSLAATGLADSANHIIPAANFSFYMEHYVFVNQASPDRGGSNRSRGPGWYPDALIPLPAAPGMVTAPVNLSSPGNQPFWLDLFVPRDAPPGAYHGRVTFSSDQHTVTVPVDLTVWSFTLPLKPSLKTSFLLWTQITPQAVELLLQNKIMPNTVSPGPPTSDPGLAAKQLDLANRLGLYLADTKFWSGADQGACVLAPAPSPAQFATAAAANSPLMQLYNYTADEVGKCPQIYEPLQNWARNMHQAGIRNLVVMDPVPALMDDGSGTGRPAVDIWVVSPRALVSGAPKLAVALNGGSEVWSYNTLAQDGYTPKWLIDFDLINYRIQPGFLNQRFGISGLLYWRVERWSADPWNDVNNQGSFGAFNYPGEGMLIYPGAAAGVNGVVPSIRLKVLRDGIEDYEYIQVLKNLGLGDWAIQLAKSIAPDAANWNPDPHALQSVREQMGRQVQSLALQGGAVQGHQPPPAWKDGSPAASAGGRAYQ